MNQPKRNYNMRSNEDALKKSSVKNEPKKPLNSQGFSNNINDSLNESKVVVNGGKIQISFSDPVTRYGLTSQNELFSKDPRADPSVSRIFLPSLKKSNEIEIGNAQMDIEYERQSKSPVFNQHSFAKEEPIYSPLHHFYNEQVESQNLSNLSDDQQFKTENEPIEPLVKIEVKMEEEQPNFAGQEANWIRSMLNRDMSFQFGPADLAVSQQFASLLQQELSLKKLEQSASPSQGLSSRKKRPGKNPYSEPKDVGRHFLKVHMKKCMLHVLKNMDEVYEALRSYFFDELEEPTAFSEKQKQEFILKKTMEFKDWLENLRKAFKDYGKEDFKTAYMINHKQFNNDVWNLDDSDIPKFLKNRPGDWNKTVFKETLRRLTLQFIKNPGENGLRYQLVAANNILVEEEHLRYVILTEWLIEKPSRIENSEIFGKMWVEKFFKSKNLL